MPSPPCHSPEVSALALREFWYIACTARELKGRPTARTVLGEPLVLFRETDGKPGALIDRCAHRNAALSQGIVSRGCVECPYHGWRYAADGGCVEIPSLQGGLSPGPEVRIRAYPAVEQDGFVWVWMGEGKPAFGPRPFAHLKETGWTSFLMVNRFQANVMACLENFLDCPHTVYVHQGWFRSRNAREVHAHVRRGADEVCVEFAGERDAESVISRLFFPRNGKMRHTDRFLMPTTTRVDYSFGPDVHYIITSQCTPVSARETHVYTMMTYRIHSRVGRLDPLARLVFEPISRKVIRQDVDVLRRQGEQIRKFGRTEFTFVETDLVGPHILELWRAALANDLSAPLDHHVVLRF